MSRHKPTGARRAARRPTPQLRALLDAMDLNLLLDIAIERLRKLNATTAPREET